MAGFSGHDPSNDDLTSGGQGPNDFQYGGKGADQTTVVGYGAPDEYFSGGPIYGSTPGTSSADQESARYQGMGLDAIGRQAPRTDYSAGNAFDVAGQQARGGQNSALSMIRDRAAGGGASAANIGMATGNDQASQGQLATLAGARAGNQAIAQQGASGAASGMQSANIANAGQARAGEISGAQSGLLSGYNDMRTGDLGAMRAQDARSQHIGNLLLQQRGLNQQAGLDYEGMNMGAQSAQLGANIYARMQSQRAINAQRAMDQASQNNANNNIQMWGSAATAGIGGGLGAVAKK